MLRVAAFVLFCVVLARPLLMRGRSPASDQTAKPFFGARERWILVIAAGGVVLDLIAKVVLAPWWGHLLQGMLRR